MSLCMKEMKKSIKKVIALATGISLAAACVGCGGAKDNSDDSNAGGGKTQIQISVYAAGYGTGWVDEACKLYEKEHPEYEFKVRANSRMFDTIETELSNDTCTSDIVLVAGYDYLNLATKGKLLELSDLYDSEVPDSGTKVRDVIIKEEYECRLVGDDQKIYGIPWQDMSANGFVYNKKMFAENGWEVPTTMDEFFALCDKIAEKGIAPLVYGGGQENGYFSRTPSQWLLQYYGADYMQNTFEKYESPDQYQVTAEGRLKAYETLAKLVKGKTANGSNIALTGSNAFTAQAAQREFVKGNAAIVSCGTWFPTEMASILKDYPDFEFGYFPVPHINNDKKDINGNDTSSVRYLQAANLLCIPSNAVHADVAKDFLLNMFTKESYTTFVKANNGTGRPINVEIDTESLNDFAKSVYETEERKGEGMCVYETLSSPMAVNGYLAPMNFSKDDSYLSIINSTSYEEAMKIAEESSQNDYMTAISFWDSKTNSWNSVYSGQK